MLFQPEPVQVTASFHFFCIIEGSKVGHIGRFFVRIWGSIAAM
jgi:hypothetical protein